TCRRGQGLPQSIGAHDTQNTVAADTPTTVTQQPDGLLREGELPLRIGEDYEVVLCSVALRESHAAILGPLQERYRPAGNGINQRTSPLRWRNDQGDRG